MNWYIGQEIVAVKDQQQNEFKKGDLFIIRGLRGSPCSCCNVNIDVGFREKVRMTCPCGHTEITEVHWYDETNFAPLQTDSEKADMEESLTEIFERELFV